MATFYEEMAEMATELLTEFNQGALAIIRRAAPTPPPNEYTPGDPADPAEIELKGVVASLYADNASKKYVDGTSIVMSDLVVTIEASRGTPLMTDLVEIDGVSKVPKKIIQVPAAGIPIVWKIFVAG